MIWFYKNGMPIRIFKMSNMINYKNKTFFFIVMVLSVLIISCGQDHETTLAKDTRPTVKVSITQAGGSSQEGHFTVSGKIQSDNTVQVSSQLMGALTGVSINEGDRVYAGQTLARINNTDIKAKIAQADAAILEANTSLANIEKDYNRILNLYNKKSATQKEMDDITAHQEMMKAKINQAEEVKNEITAMLSYSVVKAPISGIVSQKFISSGDLASPGKPLFSIESTKKLQVSAMIPEQYITGLNKGDKVTVIVKSSGQELSGIISEQSQSSLHTGGQYEIKINLNKSDQKGVKLFSGMYVNVLIAEKGVHMKPSKKILVDKDVIVSKGQLQGLYTVSDQNTAVLRWVRVGRSYGSQVEILSGLSEGESYINKYEGRLLNGVKVELK